MTNLAEAPLHWLKWTIRISDLFFFIDVLLYLQSQYKKGLLSKDRRYFLFDFIYHLF